MGRGGGIDWRQEGCDGNKIRTLLLEQSVTPGIPCGRNHNPRVPYGKGPCKTRRTVEILLAGWRLATHCHPLATAAPRFSPPPSS